MARTQFTTGLIGAATKVIPLVFGVQTGGAVTLKGTAYFLRLNSSGDLVEYQFIVPYDFVSLTSAYLLVFADADRTDWDEDIYSQYAKEGEAYNTHQESDVASTYNFTQDEFTKIDLSGILSSLEVEDHVTIRLQHRETGNLLVPYGVGGEIRYS